MGPTLRIVLLAGFSLAVVSCGSKSQYDGPKVDAFVGRIVQNGQPVTIPDPDNSELKLFHQSGVSFGIPLQADGSFTIGWMMVGRYTVMYNRDASGAKSAPVRYSAPDPLVIEEGKTQYEIEMGKDWKP